MVHCLEVLKRINAEAVSKPELKKPYVPENIALNPALARRYVNRPWTAKELGGKESVYESYARSEREPFHIREGKREELRT